MSGNVLRFEGLGAEFQFCATCLIVQKSAFLANDEIKKELEISGKKPGIHITYIPINKNLPCEEAITIGPSTVLPGPNAVCATHLATTPQSPLAGTRTALITDGSTKMRHW